MDKRTIRLKGDRLAAARMRAHLSQTQLATLIGMSEANIQRLERNTYSKFFAKYIPAMSRALQMTPDQLLADLCVVEAADAPPGIAKVDQLDVEEVKLYRSLLASRLGYGEDRGEVVTLPKVRLGKKVFAAIVEGDCMAPEYLDGMTVVFSADETEARGVELGKDYYVQLDGSGDDQNTFKRIVGMSDETYTLAAINSVKYPQPIIVQRDAVVRMARAVWKGQRL